MTTKMRTHAIVAAVLGLALGAVAPHAVAQQDTEREKLAQTGMKFLSISVTS